MLTSRARPGRLEPVRPHLAPLEGDHRETWPLRSAGFKLLLGFLGYQKLGKAATSQSISDALGTLEGKALFEGAERPVHLRLAGDGDRTYVDLCDPDWNVVEISATGWRVSNEFPPRFRRKRGMPALPRPEPGGDLEELRQFINVASDDDWRLLVCWLVAGMRPVGPYPVLVLHGEQGSAKSSTARLLRELIDPNTAALRSTPHGIRDLMIAADSGWIITFDNLSYLRAGMSDAICRLATGGGFSTRELYSDDEERIFDVQRPVILNGIDELVTRSDLLDRAAAQPAAHTGQPAARGGGTPTAVPRGTATPLGCPL
jgi:hypothetical protein